MGAALKILLDKQNHPLLIHCNKGKVSSSTCVGHKQILDLTRLHSIVPVVLLDASASSRTGALHLFSPSTTITPIRRQGCSTRGSLSCLTRGPLQATHSRLVGFHQGRSLFRLPQLQWSMILKRMFSQLPKAGSKDGE